MIAYDSVKQRVKLSDGWGYVKTFPLSEVWLPPANTDATTARRRIYVTLLGTGAVAGALLGSIVTALLSR